MWSQWEFNYQVRKALHLWGWSNGTSFSLLCMCQCAHIHIYVFLYVSSALKQIHWYLYWLIQNLFHQAWLYRCLFVFLFHFHMLPGRLYLILYFTHRLISDIWFFAGRRARWLMPLQTWTTRKPSASLTTTTDQSALASGRQSVPAPNCSSAPASRPWQVRGHKQISAHAYSHLHKYRHCRHLTVLSVHIQNE